MRPDLQYAEMVCLLDPSLSAQALVVSHGSVFMTRSSAERDETPANSL